MLLNTRSPLPILPYSMITIIFYKSIIPDCRPLGPCTKLGPMSCVRCASNGTRAFGLPVNFNRRQYLIL